MYVHDLYLNFGGWTRKTNKASHYWKGSCENSVEILRMLHIIFTWDFTCCFTNYVKILWKSCEKGVPFHMVFHTVEEHENNVK